MYRRFLAVSEEAGRFNHHVHFNVTPRNSGRIALAKDPNLFAIHLQMIIGSLNGYRQRP
ncbi:hypothetical protein D3C81_2198390 [compost metagenome]